jgi:DNA end-binding protein Ku
MLFHGEIFMPQHAYWTGYVRLSLVTFPVRLYTAIAAGEKIRLHKYDRESGQRIHYQNVNEDGEVVDPDDIVKGYEYEKGSFVPIEDKELEKLKLESKHTIDIVQFADLASIDPIYYDNPYYIAPDGDIAQDAYLTLREALKKSKKVALGQVVLHNKERIVALKPCGKGMVLETLRYNYEVRRAEDYFDGVKSDADIDKDQLDLALELAKRKSGRFDPKKFKDLYQEGLKEIINAKIEKRPVKFKDGRPPPGKVINIMDALRKSLEQSGDARKKKPASTRKAKPRRAGKKSVRGKKAA